MLEVRGATVRYGHGAAALDDLDLVVSEARVVAVVGGNGAGKTTAMRLVSGVLPAFDGRLTSGEVFLRGERITGLNPAAIVRRGIAHVPEGRQVFTSLTVEENLLAGAAALRSKPAALIAQAYERFPVLGDRRRQPAGLLSGGEQQMLAIARGLMSSPTVLLLDEPTLGLAPLMVQEIGRVVSEISAGGTAVLIVEQNAAMALSVSHTASVLEQGRVVLHGTAAELLSDPSVQDRYLGRAADAERPLDEDRCALRRWSA